MEIVEAVAPPTCRSPAIVSPALASFVESEAAMPVSWEPSTAGSFPVPSSLTNPLAALNVLPCRVTEEESRVSLVPGEEPPPANCAASEKMEAIPPPVETSTQSEAEVPVERRSLREEES
jgi:hypothetical protein